MSIKGLPGGKEVIQKERKALGKMIFEEKVVAAVFIFAAFMWITREFIWVSIMPDLKDGMIAVLATAFLFAIPTTKKFGTRILTGKTLKKFLGAYFYYSEVDLQLQQVSVKLVFPNGLERN